MKREESEERKARLRKKALNLPECPGCYQYIDVNGKIIYVGKAKNLRRRVHSYFSKDIGNRKTAMLVSKIADIKYVVVNSEKDALLLENNLIKQWQPKYNILLKDGKTYPSIVVTNEYIPRIFQTRKIIKGFGTYFGPYSQLSTMNMLLSLIKDLYPLRRCKEKITERSIMEGKHRLCLEYHIKNCEGICKYLHKREDYMKYINECIEILKGNTTILQHKMLNEMQKLAEEMQFEEAETIKKRYLLLENYRSRSEVVSNSIKDVDVFNIEDSEKVAYVNYLHITNGCITQAFTFEYSKRLDEQKEDILVAGIVEMRARYHSESKEIIVPFPVELPIEETSTTIPQKGDKKRLLDLSKLNVLQYKKDRISESEKLNPEQKNTRILTELQNALGLCSIPWHIECFDNSNISGQDAVAGCIVFKKGKPCKKEYRKFIVKTVEGANDYASMKEIVARRYNRILEEKGELPDLIFTDGGKGQMEAVREIIEDTLHLQIPIAGLVKDDKHRTNELLFGIPPQTVSIRVESSLFQFLTKIQDEVHRYAISFHRNRRSKHQIGSELDSIIGIGPKTKERLLKKWKSVKRLKEATQEELEATIGKNKAALLIAYFKRS